jgi:hypothetical protein
MPKVEIKVGDIVDCNGLKFTVKSFDQFGLACGKYGCFATDLLTLHNSQSNRSGPLGKLSTDEIIADIDDKINRRGV